MSALTPAYALVANGSTSTPVLNIALNSLTYQDACAECAPITTTLSAAGYFNFTLYDVTASVAITAAVLTVNTPRPTMTVRDRRPLPAF
jgi:hypothetical protein